jgi:hypothetical protein
VVPHVSYAILYNKGDFYLKTEIRILIWTKLSDFWIRCTNYGLVEGIGQLVPNPKFLAGSESEKKFGFGSRYCYKIKITQKNQRLNT